jgi:hypothetical protein
MTKSTNELSEQISQLDLTCKSQVACRRQRAVLLNIKKLTDTIRKELLQQSAEMKKPKAVVESVEPKPVEPVVDEPVIAEPKPVEVESVIAESLIELSKEPTPRKLKKTKR